MATRRKITTNPSTSDQDFAKYKAIAMACDNGTSFPASPATGQWFYRTDIDTLFIYEAAWKPIISFTDINIYLDATGNDNNDGYSSDAPKATLSAAWNCVPGFCGGDTYINVTGTINADVTLQGKVITAAGKRIYIKGVESASALESFVATAIDATNGTVTKVGQFAGDSYRGYILKNVTNNWETIIFEHTDDVITVVGDLWGTRAVTDTWEVRDFGANIQTSVENGVIDYQDYLTIERIKFPAAAVHYRIILAGFYSDLRRCTIVANASYYALGVSSPSAILYDVMVMDSSTQIGIVGTRAYIGLNRVGIYNCKTALSIRRMGYVNTGDVCRIDLNSIANSIGVELLYSSLFETFSASANSVIKNGATGFSVLYMSSAINNGRFTLTSITTASVVDTATANGVYTA